MADTPRRAGTPESGTPEEPRAESPGEEASGREGPGQAAEGGSAPGEPGPRDSDGPRPGEEAPKSGPDNGWPTRSHMASNRGQAVQAGQVNGGISYHSYVYSDEVAERVRSALRIDERKIATIRATYVACKGYDRFEGDLRQAGVGIVVGEPGTGRGASAIHALAALRPETPIQEEMPDLSERDAGLSSVTVDKDRTYLIDVSHAGDIGRTQQAAVRSFAARVREAGTVLIVIVNPRQWTEEFGEAYAWLEIEEPPPPLEVFHASMRYRTSAADADRWCGNGAVRTALENAEPGRATQLAGLAARDRPEGETLGEDAYRAWVDSVVETFADSAKRLRTWFASRDHADEFQRVLLEAVALLEGAPCPVVLERAHALADRWKIPSVWRTPISGRGLSELLRDFPAEVTGDRIRFTRPELGGAALDHLWREHPHARSGLLEWSRETAEALSVQDKRGLADRWLRLGLRHSDPAPVIELMREWGSTPRLIWSAVPAVAEAAVTVEIGSRVRAELYQIAHSGGTWRLRMAAEVCGVYGRAQPRSAMVRLRLIAARVPHQWADSIVGIIENIAQEQDNLEAVLEELTTWGGDSAWHGHRRHFAVQGLARLLTRRDGQRGAPVPSIFADLAAGRVTQDTITECWRTLSADPGQTSRAMWAWLDAFETQANLMEPVPASLRAAASSDPELAAMSIRAINRWRLAHGRRVAAIERLYAQINDER